MEERKKLELRRGYRVRAGEDERVEVGPKVPRSSPAPRLPKFSVPIDVLQLTNEVTSRKFSTPQTRKSTGNTVHHVETADC